MHGESSTSSACGNRPLASLEIRRKSADANVCVSFLPTVAVPGSDCAIFERVYSGHAYIQVADVMLNVCSTSLHTVKRDKTANVLLLRFSATVPLTLCTH